MTRLGNFLISTIISSKIYPKINARIDFANSDQSQKISCDIGKEKVLTELHD